MKEITREFKVVDCNFPECHPVETIIGTSYQGEMNTSFAVLKKVFGKHIKGDGDKIDAEWRVMTPDGIATIYNWKDGKNYCGSKGLPLKNITEWHIGGHNKSVIGWVICAVAKY